MLHFMYCRSLNILIFYYVIFLLQYCKSVLNYIDVKLKCGEGTHFQLSGNNILGRINNYAISKCFPQVSIPDSSDGMALLSCNVNFYTACIRANLFFYMHFISSPPCIRHNNYNVPFCFKSSLQFFLYLSRLYYTVSNQGCNLFGRIVSNSIMAMDYCSS